MEREKAVSVVPAMQWATRQTGGGGGGGRWEEGKSENVRMECLGSSCLALHGCHTITMSPERGRRRKRE